MQFEPIERKHRGLRLAPLVDVVFLLAGTLEPSQPIEADPPEAEHSQPDERGALRIFLDANGRIGFEGRVLDMEALAEGIGSRAGPDLPRAAQVEADSEVAAGSVLAPLEQLRTLGLEEFQLVTRPRRTANRDDG